MKKILFFSLVLVLVLMVSPELTSAKTKVSFKKGTIRLYGKGKFKSRKYSRNKKVKKVIVGKNVTSICDRAFSDCTKLKKVVFNKKLKSIGHEAFMNTGIKKIHIFKKTNKIGDGAFYGCKKLQKITMPGTIKKYSRGDDEIGTIADKAKEVVFTSSTNMYTFTHINAAKYVVNKKDKKYISVKGGIYQKSDYQCVRIPELETFTISDKSTLFDLNNIYHSKYNVDDTYFSTNKQLKKIVLPKGISKIIYTKTANYNWDQKYYKPAIVPGVVVENTLIDENSKKVLEEWLMERKR